MLTSPDAMETMYEADVWIINFFPNWQMSNKIKSAYKWSSPDKGIKLSSVDMLQLAIKK